MNNQIKTVLAIVVSLAVLLGIALWLQSLAPTEPMRNDAQADGVITANFACNADKSIGAMFNNEDDSVTLSLSDGRTMDLAHVVSADGARYANADESFVFWNVGNTATVMENGTTTYSGCTTPVNS